MTAAERMTVASALGPDVLAIAERLEGEERAPLWRELLETLYRQHSDVMATPFGCRVSVAVLKRVFRVPIPAHPRPASGVRSRTDESSRTDSYVPSGRIGRLDLTRGCFTTIDVFNFVACDLVARGLDTEVRALLLAGRQTVRDFLHQTYGCLLGPREYFTPSHLTPPQADAKDFVRILERVAGAQKRKWPKTFRAILV